MSDPGELLQVLLFGPPAWLLSGWAGRQCQRIYWGMDRERARGPRS